MVFHKSFNWLNPFTLEIVNISCEIFYGHDPGWGSKIRRIGSYLTFFRKNIDLLTIFVCFYHYNDSIVPFANLSRLFGVFFALYHLMVLLSLGTIKSYKVIDAVAMVGSKQSGHDFNDCVFPIENFFLMAILYLIRLC